MVVIAPTMLAVVLFLLAQNNISVEMAGIGCTGNVEAAAKVDFDERSKRWKKSPITWRIEAPLRGTLMTAQDQISILQKQFEAWGNAGAGLQFKHVEGKTADIVISWWIGRHDDILSQEHIGDTREDCIVFDPMGIASHTTNYAGSQMLGTIHFNAKKAWFNSDTGNSKGVADADIIFESLHAIGHVLGLKNSNAPNVIMNPDYYKDVYKTGIVKKIVLQPEDKEQITAVYLARPEHWKEKSGSSGCSDGFMTKTTTSFDEEGCLGWCTGQLATVCVVRPTSTIFCEAHTSCEQAKPGHTGKVFRYIYVDKCKTGTHGCDSKAKCTTDESATDGYTCKCNQGYQGSGQKGACADVNECAAVSTCDKNAVCTNTVGSFTCACKPDYRGPGVGNGQCFYQAGASGGAGSGGNGGAGGSGAGKAGTSGSAFSSTAKQQFKTGSWKPLADLQPKLVINGGTSPEDIVEFSACVAKFGDSCFQEVAEKLKTQLKASKVAMIIHGYGESGTPWSTRMAASIRKTTTFDATLVVHWKSTLFSQIKSFSTGKQKAKMCQTGQSKKVFTPLAISTAMMGEYLARFVQAIQAKKVEVHVIGFGLGAHAAGHIFHFGKVKPDHITGLDPSGPCFDDDYVKKSLFSRRNSAQKWGLDASCAKFVDVYHTNGAMYGTSVARGHVDVYAGDQDNAQFNMGMSNARIQSDTLHMLAVSIYEESINNPSTSLVSNYRPAATTICKMNGGCNFAIPFSRNSRYWETVGYSIIPEKYEGAAQAIQAEASRNNNNNKLRNKQKRTEKNARTRVTVNTDGKLRFLLPIVNGKSCCAASSTIKETCSCPFRYYDPFYKPCKLPPRKSRKRRMIGAYPELYASCGSTSYTRGASIDWLATVTIMGFQAAFKDNVIKAIVEGVLKLIACAVADLRKYNECRDSGKKHCQFVIGGGRGSGCLDFDNDWNYKWSPGKIKGLVKPTFKGTCTISGGMKIIINPDDGGALRIDLYGGIFFKPVFQFQLNTKVELKLRQELGPKIPIFSTTFAIPVPGAILPVVVILSATPVIELQIETEPFTFEFALKKKLSFQLADSYITFKDGKFNGNFSQNNNFDQLADLIDIRITHRNRKTTSWEMSGFAKVGIDFTLSVNAIPLILFAGAKVEFGFEDEKGTSVAAWNAGFYIELLPDFSVLIKGGEAIKIVCLQGARRICDAKQVVANLKAENFDKEECRKKLEKPCKAIKMKYLKDPDPIKVLKFEAFRKEIDMRNDET